MPGISDFSLSLDGHKVIVAGAGGGGMGTAITAAIASVGGTVLAVDNNADNLSRHIEPLINSGLSVQPLLADVLTEAGIEQMLDACNSMAGDLHGLVTVIGGAPPATWGPTTTLSRQHWHQQLGLNVDSMLFPAQAVAATLQREGRPGSIVAISSINGVTTSPYNVGYGAGKAALQSVVRTMALELADTGIRVNAIAPGPVVTPTANLSQDPQRLKRGIPMARFGDPGEIAGPALFLLSNQSTYMTGQCLLVDGGCSIKWCHLNDDNLPMFLKEDSANMALNLRDAHS